MLDVVKHVYLIKHRECIISSTPSLKISRICISWKRSMSRCSVEYRIRDKTVNARWSSTVLIRRDSDQPAQSAQSDRRWFRITHRQASLTTFYGSKQEDFPSKEESKGSYWGEDNLYTYFIMYISKLKWKVRYVCLLSNLL